MKPLLRSLYFQVIVAIALGVLLGALYPQAGAMMQPLGDGFIKLIKMLIAPVIFCTVVTGIAGVDGMKKVGKTGGLALIYFEIMSTVALLLGLAVVNVVRPGAGMNVDARTLDAGSVAAYTGPGKLQSATDFLLNVIPTTVVDAFAKGEILQVLLFAVLFGFALQRLGARGAAMLGLVDGLSQVLFGIVAVIMKLAPLGAFGAMAATVGKYGFGSLLSLGALMASFYATCLLFIFGALGMVARLHGFSIWRFVAYIRDELFIVLGTSSSESVLPRMIAKLQKIGVVKAGGGAGHSGGLFLQSRRHLDLPDDGHAVHCSGDQYADEFAAAAHAARGAAVDLQGSGRRDRQRFHRAGRDAVLRRHPAGGGSRADFGNRPVHVGGARAHQCDRQRRRDAGGREMDRRAGCRHNAP